MTTLQQVAADNAQSLVVASEATPAALERGSYSATTPEEIQAKKDEEAAKAAAATRIAAATTTASSDYTGSLVIDRTGRLGRATPAVLQQLRRRTRATRAPTTWSTAARRSMRSPTASSSPPTRTVRAGVSTSRSPHNIGGQSVTSLYAHMLYGSRRVAVGDITVRAGQIIGQVSDTGLAYGTCTSRSMSTARGSTPRTSCRPTSTGCVTLIPTLAEAEGKLMDQAGAGIRTMDALCRNVSGRYVLRHRVHESRGIRRATKALSR